MRLFRGACVFALILRLLYRLTRRFTRFNFTSPRLTSSFSLSSIVARRSVIRPGQVIGLYMVLYSAARFVIEFFREHEQSLVGPFSLTQWIALGVFIAGAAILLLGRQDAPLSVAQNKICARLTCTTSSYWIDALS